MSFNITDLLPTSVPTQNAHRLMVVTAEAQPDEFARLEIAAADAIAAAREALRAFDEGPIAERGLQSAFRALAGRITKGRILEDGFHELAEETLARIGSDTPAEQCDRIRRALSDALPLSRRVADLLAAEREIGWRRGIGRDA